MFGNIFGRIKKLKNALRIDLDKIKYEYNLYSNEDLIIKPKSRAIIKTGLNVRIPNSFYTYVKKAELFKFLDVILKYQLNYDEIYLDFYNNSNNDLEIKDGEIIAHLVIIKTPKFKIKFFNNNLVFA